MVITLKQSLKDRRLCIYNITRNLKDGTGVANCGDRGCYCCGNKAYSSLLQREEDETATYSVYEEHSRRWQDICWVFTE